jgi:hypothetical protein
MDWEKIKHGSWGAVVGSLVTMYVGFNIGGWMTNGSAEVMAKETAATAVAEPFGNDLRGAVQPGHGEEPETHRDEGQRYLGDRPLYRQAELGDHAR